MSCDGLGHGHDHGVAELPVGLGVGDGNSELRRGGLLETHQAGEFPGREAAGHPSLPPDQDFGAVLVVARREGAGDVVRPGQPEPEAVALPAVLLGLALEVLPETVGHTNLR